VPSAGVDDGLAVAVGGARRDEGGGEQEDRAGQQGAVEACGKRGIGRGVRGEQRAGARGGDGGEDRQPESGTQLLGGRQEQQLAAAGSQQRSGSGGHEAGLHNWTD
jgi:hypothetical protein